MSYNDYAYAAITGILLAIVTGIYSGLAETPRRNFTPQEEACLEAAELASMSGTYFEGCAKSD